MAQLCPKVPEICRRFVLVRRYFRIIWDRVCVVNALGKPSKYKQLPRRATSSVTPKTPLPSAAIVGHPVDRSFVIKKASSLPPQLSSALSLSDSPPAVILPDKLLDHMDSDLVAMKISLLGDPQIGKTSFLAKYVGSEKELESKDCQIRGLNCMDKIQYVQGARLFFSIWEVGGDLRGQGHVPAACKDSVAILFMFDLTSRCTLNSVISWFQEARKWNQTAIPILIGTKFDDFVQLPIDLQWTIASQARAYAKAINATLFFSSSTYNINVNKVFKFITAKLFNLPWSVERNLTIGEPIIDF